MINLQKTYNFFALSLVSVYARRGVGGGLPGIYYFTKIPEVPLFPLPVAICVPQSPSPLIGLQAAKMLSPEVLFYCFAPTDIPKIVFLT
jgi:hypothetical protein